MSVEGLAALIVAITGLVSALGALGLHFNLRKQIKANAAKPVVTVPSSQGTNQH